MQEEQWHDSSCSTSTQVNGKLIISKSIFGFLVMCPNHFNQDQATQARTKVLPIK